MSEIRVRSERGSGGLDDLGLRSRFGGRNHKVLFIDGPLKGQALPVSERASAYRAVDSSLPEGTRYEHPVTYRLTQVGFHHGGSKVVLRIATVDLSGWSADDLADVMLSKGALEARIRD